MLIGRYRLFAVLIGAYAGAAVLGEVHLAFRLVDTLRDLTFTALWRLMLPALCRIRGTSGRCWRRWTAGCAWPACHLLPLCAGLVFGLARGSAS